MLGDGRLGVVEVGYQIFVADLVEALVLLHDITEDLDAGRMGQGIGYFSDEEYVFFLHFVDFFSKSHVSCAP